MSGLKARAFPGSSAVWAACLVAILVSAALVGHTLLGPSASFTGTNSVGVAAVVAQAAPEQETCIRDLVVPRATRRVEVWQGIVDVSEKVRFDAWVENLDTPRIALRYVGSGDHADFKPYALASPIREDLRDAKVCIRAHGGAVNFGGASVMRLPNAATSSVGAKTLEGVDIGVRFRRSLNRSPGGLDALGAALDRATIFKPRLARSAIYVFAVLLILSIYPIGRVAATADRYRVRRLATGAALVALVHACAWVFLLQPFHGADESEHFAYAQHLAATGTTPDASQTSRRPAYASSELRLMEAVHHNSTILNSSSRLRWDRYYVDRYKDSLNPSPSNADGGGYTESATGHSPFYYGIIGLPYRMLTRPSDLPSALLLMRLFNAVLASLIAAIAVLTASYVFPNRKTAAWLSGVLVATQPVFGSVSAAVNNDTAVNLLAATMVFLLVRSWKLGFGWRDALLIGALAILLPVAKITGFALLPVIGLTAVVFVLRHGSLAAARWVGVAAIGAGMTAGLWILVMSPLMGGGRGSLINVHPVAGQAASRAMVADTSPTASEPEVTPVSLSDRAEYLLETFIPEASFEPDRWQIAGPTPLTRWPAFAIYLDRGYGLFGWKSTRLPYNGLRLILLALTLGWVLVLVAGVRGRARWRDWSGAAIILGGTVASVLTFISYAYASNQVRSEPGEQGRYLFTAIVPLAVLFSGAAVAFRGRMGQAVVGVGVSAAWALAVIAWTTALRGWYM